MLIGIEESVLRNLLREELTGVLNKQFGNDLANKSASQEMITQVLLKQILSKKGYSVKSSVTIKRIVIDYKIRFEKRGRELWYSLQDVNHNVPSKV